jgi:hypothetical protein
MMSAASAAVRWAVACGAAAITRVQAAISTAVTQMAISASIQPRFASLPVPRPCTTATGQET